MAKADETEAQRQFWRDFYEKHGHLSTAEGRKAVDWVMKHKLASLQTLPLSEAREAIAETAQSILKEAEPPPSLGSTINFRRQVRRSSNVLGATRHE